MRPEQAALRRKWMDAYKAAGGEVEQDIPLWEPALSATQRCDVPLTHAPCNVAPPAALPVGTADFYTKRADDFTERHGGPPPDPPSYYLDYGDKYRERFAALNSGDLSAEGLRWRDCTLEKLQQLIEDKRAADPCGFADLELDSAAFKRFAFDSHVEAYTSCGLLKLPATDLVRICFTPDGKDLLDPDGRAQVRRVLGTMEGEDWMNIAKATYGQATEAVRELYDMAEEAAERAFEWFE